MKELTLRDIRPVCGHKADKRTKEGYTLCSHPDNKKDYCNSFCPILIGISGNISPFRREKAVDNPYHGDKAINSCINDKFLAYTASGEKVKYYHQCKGKVYLSGAITNNTKYKEDFEKADKLIKKKGFEAFNPTTIKADSYQDYLRKGLSELLKCDFIYYVNDTRSSKGAFVEKMVADAIGIDEFMFWI